MLYPVELRAARAGILGGRSGPRGSALLDLSFAKKDLTLPTTGLPDLDPITASVAFYRMAAELAQARGLDPDHPRHLSKITRTH